MLCSSFGPEEDLLRAKLTILLYSDGILYEFESSNPGLQLSNLWTYCDQKVFYTGLWNGNDDKKRLNEIYDWMIKGDLLENYAESSM